MNNNRSSQLLVFGLLFVLTACQAAGQPLSAAMVGSGSQINGISLTKGAADAPSLWSFCSSAEKSNGVQTLDCHAPLLPSLAIGHVFLLADQTLKNLDASQLNWELSIDDQAIDLESFGTFDYVVPSMGKSPSPVREVFRKVTAWNIVMTNLNPGEHTLRFEAKDHADQYTWLVHLVIERVDGTNISTIPFAPKS